MRKSVSSIKRKPLLEELIFAWVDLTLTIIQSKTKEMG
eukprot:CAMPEP_0205825032 /NCGR_PEP_ID=MMETSP0206-20130828/23665_1 /ASSEMBLY_ACC=CAM_ASM_000279 /TAXON_ID=36767 /ORGANISM="Euplotes focardii, Strain TN1" /LENGTH=37 /DNA_ID= /DNA_START= /DNA_END= /DNA_ORIENTATION=